VYDDLHLLPGERLLWSGGPESRPVFMQIWGIPFILFGVYLVAGRLVVRALQLRSTTYAVTDRRLIETVRRPRRRVTEAYLSLLAPPVMQVGPDGATGSIAFGAFPGLAESLAETGFANRRGRRREPRAIVLRGIAQPQQVRDIIATAQH
jgi:hypothetical protein